MFPLPILTYVKIGLVVLALSFSWYLGYSFEAGRFDRYKTEQATAQAQKESEYQESADKIEKEKNAQIANINNQLADALIELRKRPSRAQTSSDGQGGTGLSLSAEDASFLDREAARADGLRSALQACYAQYDSLSQ